MSGCRSLPRPVIFRTAPVARIDPQRQEGQLIALLIGMVMLAPFAVDAYLPVLPAVARDLGAPDALIQMSVGGFLLGTATGPILAGPLSDALGRRAVILGGLAGFCLCAIGCALAGTGEALLAWRFAQALCGSAAMVSGQALLSDLFGGDKLAQRGSTLMIFTSLAPMIAPVFGAWIAALLDWRAIFWALSALAAVVFVTGALKLPETLGHDRRERIGLVPLLRGYGGVIAHPVALIYILAAFFMSGAFFAFLAGSPFVYIDMFGLSPSTYAWIFAASAGLAALGNMANVALVARFGFRRTIYWQGVAVVALGALIFCGAFGLLGRWAIFAGGVALMAVQHWITTNTMAGVLDQFETRKGLANAAAMATRFTGGFLAVWLIGQVGASVQGFGLILFTFMALAGVLAQFAVRREGRVWT